MTATRTPKQTAGNNAALRAIKKAMNAPTYATCLALMNSEGPEAVRAHLRRNCFRDGSDSADRLMDGENIFNL